MSLPVAVTEILAGLATAREAFALAMPIIDRGLSLLAGEEAHRRVVAEGDASRAALDAATGSLDARLDENRRIAEAERLRLIREAGGDATPPHPTPESVVAAPIAAPERRVTPWRPDFAPGSEMLSRYIAKVPCDACGARVAAYHTFDCPVAIRFEASTTAAAAPDPLVAEVATLGVELTNMHAEMIGFGQELRGLRAAIDRLTAPPAVIYAPAPDLASPEPAPAAPAPDAAPIAPPSREPIIEPPALVEPPARAPTEEATPTPPAPAPMPPAETPAPATPPETPPEAPASLEPPTS